MEFINNTSFPADISRTQLFYKDLLMAILVVKASYVVEADGRVVVDPNPIPLCEADAETPLGTMDGDYAPVKEKVDVMVFGQAYAPKNQPVSQMTVTLQMGSFKKALLIFGDRMWTDQQEITPPQPFLTMPITYANAYGGDALQVKDYNLQSGYASNPFGKGYVVLKEAAEGVPLPNIEDPDKPIRAFGDQPEPAGFSSVHRASSIRGMRGTRVDLEKKQTMLEPIFFNSAHPTMMVDELPSGDEISLKGMTPEGLLRFALPNHPIAAVVQLGKATTRFLMRPDTLCLLPDEKKFSIVYRRSVVYPFIPEQKRSITLSPVNEPEVQEIGAIDHQTLIEAARDPDHPIDLLSPMDESFQLPVSHEQLMQYYPLTDIIHSLPVCNGHEERNT